MAEVKINLPTGKHIMVEEAMIGTPDLDAILADLGFAGKKVTPVTTPAAANVTMARVKLPDGTVKEMPDSEVAAFAAKIGKRAIPADAAQKMFGPNRNQAGGEQTQVEQYPEAMQALADYGGFKTPADLMAMSDRMTTAKGVGGLIRGAAPAVGSLATMAFPQAGLPLRMAISGAGAMAGSGVGQAADKALSGADFSAKEALAEGAMGTVGEGIVGVIGKPLKMAADKWGKPALGALSEATFLGSFFKKRAREKIVKKYTDQVLTMADDLGLERYSKEAAGEDVGGLLKTAKTDFDTAYADYNVALKAAADANHGELFLDDFQQAYGDIIRHHQTAQKLSENKARDYVNSRLGMGPKEVRLLDSLRDDLYLDEKDVSKLINALNKGYSDMPAAVKKEKEMLKQVALGDIARLSALGKTAKIGKEAGDKVYGATQEWFKSNPVANKVISRASSGKTRLAIDEIWNAKPEEIADLKSQLMKIEGGPDAWTGVQMSWLADLIEKSTPRNTVGKRVLEPYRIIDTVEKNMAKLQAGMPELLPRIQKEVTELKKYGPDFEKLAAGSPMGGMPHFAGSALGGFLFGSGGAAIGEGAGVAAAYLLMNDAKRQALSRLINKGAYITTKTGLQLGGRAVRFEQDKQP